ncbi:MAG: type II toxin-antitoxin system VapC family toxin [Bryobacteraceae bacterium]|nr:type II toxin-antitoxin system VapC family toxin [Bryobacteraceae bacterium]
MADASVVVASLLLERKTPAALALMAECRNQDSLLVAPPHQQLEVAAAITKRVRRGTIASEYALNLYRIYREMGLVYESADLSRAFALSLSWQHSIYDCAYVALAEQLDCELYTADEHLWRKIGMATLRIRLI